MGHMAEWWYGIDPDEDAHPFRVLEEINNKAQAGQEIMFFVKIKERHRRYFNMNISEHFRFEGKCCFRLYI